MKNVRIYTLYSGSSGNCTFIRVGETAILIDAGRNAKAVRAALAEIGEELCGINAIFVTHEHSDHISALEIIAKKNDMPIYVTRQSAQKLSADSFVRKRLVEEEIIFSEEIGEMRITSFPTSHDSLMSVGYRIEFSDEDGEHAIGYATDMGYVSLDVKNALLGCEALFDKCPFFDETRCLSVLG